VELTGAVEGLETLHAQLARVAAAVQPPVLTEALAVAADVFVGAIKATAPVGSSDDGDTHPGKLRDSIEKDSAGPLTWVVGPTGDANIYAGTVEHGADLTASGEFMEFMNNGVIYRAQTVHIPAHPFIEPAALAAEVPAYEAFEAAMITALS
jgi:HK97 gp10 family phage protein